MTRKTAAKMLAGSVVVLVAIWSALAGPSPGAGGLPTRSGPAYISSSIPAIRLAVPTPGESLSATSSPKASATRVATASPMPLPTPVPEFALHVPILTYHVIAPWLVAKSYALPGLDVDPSVFAQQLAMLRSLGWRSVTVDRLSRYLADKQRPPARTFVITIDDGHEDGYTYALPILRRYGCVATFYVIAARVGELHYLTWPQIATLHAKAMEIGNHTTNHIDLTPLSASQLAYEIGGAQQLFRRHLGTAPTTFAYPFGGFDGAVARAVWSAGLRMALTQEPGAYESNSWRYEIPRLRVYASRSVAGLLALISPYA